MWNKILSPMLLIEKNKVIDNKNSIYELKYDGIRVLIYVSPNYFKIISRNKKDITYLFPELQTIKEIVNNKCIFDGEIICFDNGKISFSKLQERISLKNKNKINTSSIVNKATFICFDIIYKDSNLTNLKLIERKKILNKYNDTNEFIKSFYIIKNGQKLFQQIKKLNLEGIVCKNINSKYEIGVRSDSWIKVKNYKSKYFYIGGFSYYDNSYVFTLYLGEYVNNIFLYVGKVSISKKDTLFNKLKCIKTNKTPFSNFSLNIIYVSIKYKVKVKYLEKTKNNLLRHTIYEKNTTN